MYRYYVLNHGFPLLHWLFFGAFVAALALAVVVLVHLWRNPGRLQPVHPWAPRAGGPPPPAPGPDPALTELRVRYARGELTWDDYRERSANLGYPVAGAAGAWASPGDRPSSSAPPPPATTPPGQPAQPGAQPGSEESGPPTDPQAPATPS